MAQLNITFDQHVSLIALLKQESFYVDADAGLQQLLKELEHLQFNTKQCAWCDKEFEAPNPRKATCSDACRQALSRSKRDATTGLTAILRQSQPKRDAATDLATAQSQSQSDRDTRLPTPPAAIPTIEGTLPECVNQAVPIPPAPKGPRNRKIWHRLRVTVALRPDGTHVVHEIYDGQNNGIRGNGFEGPVTEKAFDDGFPEFSARVAHGAIADFPDKWVFSFGMHIDGTPWLGDLKVPAFALAKAQELVTAEV